MVQIIICVFYFFVLMCFTDSVYEPFPGGPPSKPTLRLPFIASQSARHVGHQYGPVVQQSRVPAERLPPIQPLLPSQGNASVLVTRIILFRVVIIVVVVVFPACSSFLFRGRRAVVTRINRKNKIHKKKNLPKSFFHA